MSDCPKCSRTTASISEQPSAESMHAAPAATIFFEVSPFVLLLAAELARSRDGEQAPCAPRFVYSVRGADNPGASCVVCRTPTGHGPVGYRNDEPICDGCLLDASPPLGLTLCLVAVTRAFAVARPQEGSGFRMALAELGAFARIFERVASTWGPRRTFVDPADERES